MLERTAPEPEIYNEEDGMVRITVGNYKGWVSSHHLIDPKVNQLIHIWHQNHNKS